MIVVLTFIESRFNVPHVHSFNCFDKISGSIKPKIISQGYKTIKFGLKHHIFDTFRQDRFRILWRITGDQSSEVGQQNRRSSHVIICNLAHSTTNLVVDGQYFM